MMLCKSFRVATAINLGLITSQPHPLDPDYPKYVKAVESFYNGLFEHFDNEPCDTCEQALPIV